MRDISDLVARQYDAFVYPLPFTDIAAHFAQGAVQMGDPAHYGPMLWPEGRAREGLSILVAGCGSVQAACFAWSNPGCEVVGVDLSRAALAHERLLQETHALRNLWLYEGDLRELGVLGRRFDLVVCTGVLHHLADPAAGLRALVEAMEPQGVLVAMLYGAARRTGVYLLQDAFRRLGLAQDADGIALVRETLATISPSHFVHWYAQATDELRHDAALIDTFLHPQDRAYTVPQLLELVAACGLRFQGWVEGSLYHPEAFFDMESALGRRIADLPVAGQWAVVENLTLMTGSHVFTARRADFDGAPPISFTDQGWRTLVAHHGVGVRRRGPETWSRGRHEFRLHPAEIALFEAIDGERNIASLVALPALAGNEPTALERFVHDFFEQAWKLGHVMLTHRPVPRAR